jgi:diaminopimelate decarboxylase
MTHPALPGAPHIHYLDRTLHIESCAVESLAREHGTPLYIYSATAMLAALRPYQTALASRDHLICYAVKANANLSVLRLFKEAGCGFDIVSGGELERVLTIGADPRMIVFSGVGKTRREMTQALRAGVMTFNVESAAELEVLSQVAHGLGLCARISVRVNPDVDAQTHPYISTGLKDNKFGIAYEQALSVYQHAATLPGIEICGIDCHIGSQITQTTPYLDALHRVLDLVERIERQGIAIDHLDLGGGLGIQYQSDDIPPTADRLISEMLNIIDARGHNHRKLCLEPGRSLVGNAGVLVTEVLYLKAGETKNFCIVDAAMNDLLRPTLYDAYMTIVACQADTSGPHAVWDVVGPVCESGDWLGKDRTLPVLQTGDFLAVLSAGAYGMSMASNYNTRARAAEVLVSASQSTLIRRRETTDDQLATER